MSFSSSIEVKNLNVYIGQQHILKNINVEIPEKKITCIIGPSGCGKTTLFKSFNRLLENNADTRIEGKVLVNGEDIYDKHADVTAIRKKMGLLNQRPTPLPMSIHANVVYGLKIHGLRDKKIIAEKATHYLKIASLWDEVKDRLDSPASKLSIGQQQRLCIARALANNPEVLLLDEPTSALDPLATQKIEELLYELRADLTIVIVTHNLQQAARVSNQTAVLVDGRLIEVDDSARLFTSPADPRTEAFITGRFG